MIQLRARPEINQTTRANSCSGDAEVGGQLVAGAARLEPPYRALAGRASEGAHFRRATVEAQAEAKLSSGGCGQSKLEFDWPPSKLEHDDARRAGLAEIN